VALALEKTCGVKAADSGPDDGDIKLFTRRSNTRLVVGEDYKDVRAIKVSKMSATYLLQQTL
jgi:hypothetical protein